MSPVNYSDSDSDCSIGYPHDGRADNAAYRHDRRADNAAYRHDRRADSLSRPPAEPTPEVIPWQGKSTWKSLE